MERILDIGCGRSKRPGALGLDILPGPEVDLVHDLNSIPWPLESGRFDLIVCSHILEHLPNLIGVMEEIHRVARPKAKVEILSPHFSSLNSWEDPTHLRHFSTKSFSFFDPLNPHHYTSRRLRTVEVSLTFGGGFWDFMGRIHYRLWPGFWEKQLAFIWRARNLKVILEVVKEEEEHGLLRAGDKSKI